MPRGNFAVAIRGFWRVKRMEGVAGDAASPVLTRNLFYLAVQCRHRFMVFISQVMGSALNVSPDASFFVNEYHSSSVDPTHPSLSRESAKARALRPYCSAAALPNRSRSASVSPGVAA